VPGAIADAASVVDILRRLGAGPGTDAVARLQVSAGPGGRGYARRATGTEWELVELLPAPAGRRLSIAVLPDGAVPPPAFPSIKSCSALTHVLCARRAHELEVDDAVRVAAGRLLEASAANLFWTVGGELFTPSADLPVYPGITRSIVMSVAGDEGWTVREGEYAPGALAGADAIFLTNATRGIERVVVVDGRRPGWPDPVRRLSGAVERARIRRGIPVGGGDGRP
jgi:branched-subunit amino acid aminotransferase/4-amino-4-deoxychorismate lyase